mmetsp:Transcript_1840/g.2529  ORF Transcript_1840/g.2529 Transcript_1840/m.2529 type:complete len:195 (+) Transcript_1840:158-742(+)
MVAKSPYTPNDETRSILKPDNQYYISTKPKYWKVLPVPELPPKPSEASSAKQPEEEARRIKKAVSFGDIQMRRYAQTLGDHPCTSRGPPISLDWKYNEEESVSVDEHESKVLATKTKRKSPVILSSSYRRKILTHKYGHDHDEIKMAIKERIKAARQREQSAKTTPSMILEQTLKKVRLNTVKILQVRISAPSA